MTRQDFLYSYLVCVTYQYLTLLNSTVKLGLMLIIVKLVKTS